MVSHGIAETLAAFKLGEVTRAVPRLQQHHTTKVRALRHGLGERPASPKNFKMNFHLTTQRRQSPHFRHNNLKRHTLFFRSNHPSHPNVWKNIELPFLWNHGNP
eukprot:1162051-Pelagomonas_calceolata.AAC.19